MTTAVAGLGDAALRALVSLLDDEDEASRALVCARLRELLRDEPERLRACAAGIAGEAGVRFAELELECAFEGLDARWRALCASPEAGLDLEAGLGLLCAYAEPGLPPGKVGSMLDALAEEMKWARTPRAEPLSVLHRYNDFLFLQCGFQPDAADPHHPDNARLDRTLERRRGSPLMLVALYALVARRLGLAVSAVTLPGRALALFETGRQRFFIDPSRGGRVLTAAECEEEAARGGPRLQSWQLLPASPRALLSRAALALVHAYARTGDRVRAERLSACQRLLAS
ncbi:MAG: transglutaminase family protein [Elusimicrobiota bacterium]